MNKIIALMAILVLACGGCALTQPGSDSMSSIVVEGGSVESVRKVTKQVFQENHYRLGSDSERLTTFERPGTADDRLRYGHYQESLTMQVEVSFEEYNDGCLIRADAFAVRGNAQFKTAVLKIARRPYNNLLKEVRDRCE